MTARTECLTPGRYEGTIDYPGGQQLSPLEVLVDGDGKLDSRWLVLPGEPSVIDRQSSILGDTYRVLLSDGSLMSLRTYSP